MLFNNFIIHLHHQRKSVVCLLFCSLRFSRCHDAVLQLTYEKLLTHQNIFVHSVMSASSFPAKDLNEIDPDDLCDDALGSDMEGSETDSKVSDSKRNGDGKSQGSSSKPRR